MLPYRAFLSPLVSKFVVATERLMFHDVDPQTLSLTDREAIRYYIDVLSEKFMTSATHSSLPISSTTVSDHQTNAG